MCGTFTVVHSLNAAATKTAEMVGITVVVKMSAPSSTQSTSVVFEESLNPLRQAGCFSSSHLAMKVSAKKHKQKKDIFIFSGLRRWNWKCQAVFRLLRTHLDWQTCAIFYKRWVISNRGESL